MSRTCYAYGSNGLYVGTSTADPDPRQPGAWILPASSTFLAPPSAPGKIAKWVGTTWTLVTAPASTPAAPGAAPAAIDLAAAARAAKIIDARDAAAAVSRMVESARQQGQIVQPEWTAYIAALGAIAATPAGREPEAMPSAPLVPVSLPPEPPPEPQE